MTPAQAIAARLQARAPSLGAMPFPAGEAEQSPRSAARSDGGVAGMSNRRAAHHPYDGRAAGSQILADSLPNWAASAGSNFPSIKM
jgi:hypothetical protein